MIKKAFEAVKLFNRTSGSEQSENLRNFKLNDFRISLIDEEVQELKDAIANKDKQEVADALADILFVTLGMADALMIDIVDVFNAVCESNMSKFCKTKVEANKSVEAYYEKGIDTYSELVMGRYVIKRTSDGKTLKGINYQEPKFTVK